MGSILMEYNDVQSYNKIYRPHIMNGSSICMQTGMIHSRGMISGFDPLRFAVPRLLAQISVSSSFILFVSRLLKPLGQPSMVAQILGGLCMGPTVFGRFDSFTSMLFPSDALVVVDAVSVFGYILYFFIIGVQMDPLVLKKVTKKELMIGTSTYFSGLVLSSSMIVPIMFFTSPVDADFVISILGAATCSSAIAFPIIALYLGELKMANTGFGRVALTSSVISSIFSYCIVSTFVFINESGTSVVSKMVIKLCGGTLMTLLIFFVFRPLILSAMSSHPEGKRVDQNLINSILVTVMVSAIISQAIGESIVVGPLLIGMAIPAGPPLGSALVEKLQLIITWFFMPLYFVKTGLVTDLFNVKLETYLIEMLVVCLACLGKFIAAFSTSVYNGLPIRESISIGLVMNVQGVMELFAMKQDQVISDQVFALLCLSMLVVTASVTTLLRYVYDPAQIYADKKKRNIMSLIPNSDFRLLACVYDEENTPAVVNLLEALHPTRIKPMNICLVQLVELVGRFNPLFIHHTQNIYNSRNSFASTRNIISNFKLFQQIYCPAAQMDFFTSISSYVSMHDIICSTAYERKASLILVPFHKKVVNNEIIFSNAGIKRVNDNISTCAPCTVAIVIDRGLVNTSIPKLEEWSPFSVAVLFLGGPDDREALAIGSRMVGHPNIRLTIVRLHETERNSRINSVLETSLDNEVLNEMQVQMGGDSRVSFVDEEVSDGTGTIKVIRSMENLFELIIVGRRHDSESLLVNGLADWNEDSGLGTIGDMFELADFENNTTIMVVKQQVSFFYDDQDEDSQFSLISPRSSKHSVTSEMSRRK